MEKILVTEILLLLNQVFFSAILTRNFVDKGYMLKFLSVCIRNSFDREIIAHLINYSQLKVLSNEITWNGVDFPLQ